MGQRKAVELEIKLNSDYWNNRYVHKEIGWDIGYANPVLIDFIVENYPKDSRILIPGLGNGYELEYLWKNGYKNCVGLDIARAARDAFLERVPDFPEQNYVVQNFFEHKNEYDVILEQTFFCALMPALRESYVIKMNELLAVNGQLVGLLFHIGQEDRPPFGGNRDEYTKLFSTHFEIVTLENCQKSIPPRLGNEYFFRIIKK